MTAVERIWRDLPGYDRPNLEEWLSRVIPVALSAQRQSVSLTEGYLARALGRRPLGLDPAGLIGSAVRNGTSSEEEWRRPFVATWTALGKGVEYEDAVAAGLSRALGTAAMDPQLSMRATFSAVQSVDPRISGYQRVADGGACAFCSEVDGAVVRSADAMPLHNNCGCGLEPIIAAETPPAPTPPPPTVAVSQHGELGPVLHDPAHEFTQL